MGTVISFYGVDHKCGTSMLAQSVAEYLADSFSDKSIILVHAEQGRGTSYSPMVRESLDGIRPYLCEKLIDTDELIEKCAYKNNLYILGGASRPGTDHLYFPDMAEYLLDKLSDSFDYVICDSGSEIEHGMTIGSLFKADAVYFVLSQSEVSVNRYEWMKLLYNKFDVRTAKYIINKYDKRRVNNLDLIAARIGEEKDRFICIKESVYGSQAEDDSRSILSFKDKSFIKSIKEICEDISTREKV